MRHADAARGCHYYCWGTAASLLLRMTRCSHTGLQQEQTCAIPVYRTQSAPQALGASAHSQQQQQMPGHRQRLAASWLTLLPARSLEGLSVGQPAGSTWCCARSFGYCYRLGTPQAGTVFASNLLLLQEVQTLMHCTLLMIRARGSVLCGLSQTLPAFKCAAAAVPLDMHLHL
jgi:hypothetical protein